MPPRPAGFALAGLLITVAVLALLAGMAVPAFRNLLADSRRTAAVNGLVRAAHGARVAAAARGADVVLCRTLDRQQCRYSGSWAAGFLGFVNRDGDNPPQVDAGEAVLLVGMPWSGGSISANRTVFVFRPPGRRSVNGTFLVCDGRGLMAARVVVVAPSGRPRAALATDSPSPVSCPG
jgi:type IV fimbrial biogenesis protein FimT